MSEFDIEKWEVKRRKGKWHFVITVGVLQIGMVSAVLYTLIKYVVSSGSFLLITPSIAFTLFPTLGIFLGLLFWSVAERAYKKALKENENT